MQRTRKRMIAVFGTTLLLLAVTAGYVGAQSSAPNPSDPNAQQSQPAQQNPPAQSQQAQPDQPQQPSAPAPGAPAQGMNSSESRSDYRSSERIVETERGRFLGMDPTIAMIIGAALLVVIVVAMVAMSSRRTNTVETHRRTL